MGELPRGIIYSFTEIGRDGAPSGFVGLAPYIMAIVEISGGLKLTARLTDVGDKKVEIGMPVEMITRKLKDGG